MTLGIPFRLEIRKTSDVIVWTARYLFILFMLLASPGQTIYMMEQFLASTLERNRRTPSPITAFPSPLQWLFSEVGEEKKMEEIDPLTVASEVIDLSSTKSPVWEYTCSKH